MKKILYLTFLLLAGYTVDAQLAGGTYTINSAVATGGTNYTSFSDAVTALSTGITGPVIFNVAAGSGPYNEQVIIPAITGASASNTIRFNGNGTSLTYASTNTNERATLKLNNADYVTIDNLNITANGTTYGYGIQLISNADHNTINNCNITASGTGLNYSGICINGSATLSYITNSLSDSNTISNNTITNGYYGITVIGDATTRISGNKVTGNTLLNAYFTGIYVVGNDRLLIEGNNISRSVLTTLGSYYGIHLNNGNLNTLVSKNKIHNFFGSLTGTSPYSIYGLWSQSVATAGNENIFSNNIVYNMDGDGAQYGIYNSNAAYTSYYNNTVCSDNSAAVSGNTYGFYQNGAATGIIFRNNIISITRGGTGIKSCMYMNTAATTFTSNNNDLYISSAAGTNNTGRFNGTDHATLTAWQTASNQDALSLSTLPLFTAPSTGDLKPNSSALDNRGLPVTGITTDILGLVRNTSTPDIGAFEFSAPVISISGNTAICSGNTATLTGTPAGGTWSSSNTTVATINNTGVVTALTAGTTVITYTTTTGTATTTVTITATPTVAAITGGAASLCVGATTTFANATPGGTWTSSNQFLATINNTTGLLTTVGPGTITVTYSVSNGSCISTATANLAIHTTTPPVISSNNIFLCQGDTTTLTASIAGGVWSSGNTAVASINNNGLVTGLSGGNTSITYTTNHGCTLSANAVITINAAPAVPAPITGNTTLCAGATTTLSSTTTGGVWQSEQTAIATVNRSTGLVTGVSAGTAVIKLTVTNASGCSNSISATVTVLAAPAAPAAITGNTNFCLGSTSTLSTVTTGGTWQSDDLTVATVDAATGLVTGRSGGATTIRYVVTNGTCTNSSSIVVSIIAPLPVISLSGNVLSTTAFSSYAWQLNNNPIPGATSQSHTAVSNGDYTVTVTDALGCSGTSAITTITSVSVPGIPASGNARLYPNPAQSHLFIETTVPAHYTISSIDGKVILQSAENRQINNVNISMLAAGLYLVKISDNKGQLLHSEKLVVTGK
jgi:parallel beta-helix repeat protein